VKPSVATLLTGSATPTPCDEGFCQIAEAVDVPENAPPGVHHLRGLAWVAVIVVNAALNFVAQKLSREKKPALFRHSERSKLPCLPPPQIGEMTQLRELDVNGDCVTDMPATITALDRLRRLGVSWSGHSDELVPMPRWIARMDALKELTLFLCRFSDLDPAIGDLPRLESLQIAGALTHVDAFPNLGSLPSLT